MLTRQAGTPAAGEDQRSLMELMLRSLSAPHREILVATYFEGRTVREAAGLLGLSPVDAKARLYQAMRHLSAMVTACRPNHAGPAEAA